jgi:glycosyltransferase involved in cell wall biosynthesis
VPEWLNGAVSKTVRGRLVPRGFESHPLRCIAGDSLQTLREAERARRARSSVGVFSAELRSRAWGHLWGRERLSDGPRSDRVQRSVSALSAASFKPSAAEAELLQALGPLLAERAALEVGFGNGELTQRLLEAGYQPVHLLRPASDAAALLRTRFGAHHDVTIRELPPACLNGDAGTTFADPETPDRVGVLRVDAGRSSYAIVEAAAEIRCDLLAVRHWRELPGDVGACPWALSDLTSLLAERGFSNFVSIRRRDDLAAIEWNDAELESGESSTLIFIREDRLDRVMPVVLEAVSRTHEQLWDRTRLARADALRSSEALAALRAEHARTAAQVAALTDLLPPPAGAEANDEPTPTATAGDAHRAADEALGRLGHLIGLRNAERERLLEDRRSSLRAWRWKTREWSTPRLGVLWQEAPCPLTVPKSYLRITAPQPAPSISIVTPSFQQGKFLERTIDSVISQRYPQLEYIVQDGGSTDESRAILERHEHSLAHWESGPDGGQANGVNLGFSRSSGEIMAYLNSDDILLPGSLAFVARYFRDHPEVDVVYGHRILIDSEDRRVGLWVMPPHDDEVLRWADCVPQETLFWRRGIWEAAGGALDAGFRYTLDWDMLLRFTDRRAKIVRVNRYLGAFRLHPEQKTTATAATGEEETRRLWRRYHGRAVEWDEALSHVRPYLRRHVRHHTLHRIAERLPRRRVSVVHGAAARREPPSERHSVTVRDSLRLAVNLRQYGAHEMGGMDVYVRNLLRGLAAKTKTMRLAMTVFTVESQVGALRALSPEADYRLAPDHSAGLSIAPEFDRDAHDALFCPLFILDPAPAGVTTAVTLPDLQHEFFPHYLDPLLLEYRRRAFRASARHADMIFTLSEFSKRTITDLYGVASDKIVVTHLDVDDQFRYPVPLAPSARFAKLALPDDYLFYPASFLPHKNHGSLLRALKILVETGRSTLGLVLSAPSGSPPEWLEDEIARVGVSERVRIIEFQPRDVNVELFRHARALVFPSRFEGFGLPLLEAFHAGTPVIASGVGSCQEVAGDAALYVDENDPPDIAAAVERVLSNPDLARELTERGRKRTEFFSWEQTVESTINSLAALPRRSWSGVSS